MENDVPLLMHSWAPNAMKLFEEEFKELQNLSQMEEGTLLAELEQAKRQAAEEAERLLRPSTGGAAGGKKAPVSSKGNRHAEDAAFNAAKMAKVLEERALQLQEKNAQQTWRQLVSRYEEQQERATAAAKPVLQWEHKELEFFTSHNTDYYTMGDILAVDRPRPQEAASSSSGPVRSNSAPSSPSRASRNNSVLEQSATAPSYIIDAVQFAQAYNEALEKEYAYKVVLGSHDLPVSSTHTAEAEDNDLLHTRLKEHKPGLDLPPNDFCVSQDHGAAARTLEATKKDFFLPSLTAAAATYSGGKTAADGGLVAPLSSSLTLPSLKVKREATGKKKTAASKRGKSQPPLTTDKLSTRGATQTKKGPSTEGIECSHSALDLHSCAGQVVQVVLRFTNRRSFRTRLRVRNATHPWLNTSAPTLLLPPAPRTRRMFPMRLRSAAAATLRSPSPSTPST
ncbi:hypothetical protein AGDE_15239 [Angomonas deanei]|uniref:Uncharacterized protein n=1 Tax=Angomonas deanei TaxID=59799 RepID=A0A7G2CBY1_9TRYP|nr:hypothetical protein AGDE_15239 [Angomonas deanei]CAD2217308.1 hypothetical protein, conserved [Angomonas deanei]|eukprot:EPY19428.1 hypothetical protein AGDE_15239 [Angomonas deanei]